jgi:hypothetical protein
MKVSLIKVELNVVTNTGFLDIAPARQPIMIP